MCLDKNDTWTRIFAIKIEDEVLIIIVQNHSPTLQIILGLCGIRDDRNLVCGFSSQSKMYVNCLMLLIPNGS